MKGTRTIPDDRGQRIALVHPSLFIPIWGADPAMRQRLRAARHRFSRSGDGLRGMGAGLLTVLAIATGAYWLLGPQPLPCAHPGMVGAMLAMAAWIFFGDFAYDRHAIADEMKREALCPSCAFDLLLVEPDEDGCRVCADCRAAWRLDRDSQHAPQSHCPVSNH